MIKFNELFECENNLNICNQKENKYKIPWVDKYRPIKLSEIVYQYDVIKMLQKVIQTGNMPHLLFYGPPGTGKTSTILAISRELFGPKKFKERIIELNASDERGINIVRNKIVTLAKTSVSEKDPNYLCPPFKIIILDEADAMTDEAQSALRKTMEDNSSVTRFCFICNYINQIIDPITSRCVKFRFKAIDEKHICEKIKLIADNENMKITQDAIEKLANISNGDMRKSIMLLQNLNYRTKEIQISDIYEIGNVVSISKLKNMINLSINYENKELKQLVLLINEIIMDGYSINLLLSDLIELIIHEKNLNEKMKSLICIHIANTEKKLIDGADEYLQLLSVFMYIKSISCKKIDLK